jgi:hypothetical protein
MIVLGLLNGDSNACSINVWRHTSLDHGPGLVSLVLLVRSQLTELR